MKYVSRRQPFVHIKSSFLGSDAIATAVKMAFLRSHLSHDVRRIAVLADDEKVSCALNLTAVVASTLDRVNALFADLNTQGLEVSAAGRRAKAPKAPVRMVGALRIKAPSIIADWSAGKLVDDERVSPTEHEFASWVRNWFLESEEIEILFGSFSMSIHGESRFALRDLISGLGLVHLRSRDLLGATEYRELIMSSGYCLLVVRGPREWDSSWNQIAIEMTESVGSFPIEIEYGFVSPTLRNDIGSGATDYDEFFRQDRGLNQQSLSEVYWWTKTSASDAGRQHGELLDWWSYQDALETRSRLRST